MPRISAKNQVTLPVAELKAAGLGPGDDVVIAADRRGKLSILKREQDIRALFANVDAGFQPGDLEAIRAEERFG